MTVSAFRSFFALGFLAIIAGCSDRKIDFSAEVKPILNKNCIACHGGVKQNGGFSVLFREEALDTTESGKVAIVPGHPDQSEMIRRLRAKDPEARMPYKKEPLSDHDIEILEKWIAQGAVWGEHWAYTPPVATSTSAKTVLTGLNDNLAADMNIDELVQKKLKEVDLQPSQEADRATLIRRVYLDVIGIPPSPEVAKSFIDDSSPDAYENMVNELLNAPQYGEKWASWWLDLARYADTKGYERDVYRNIWRYRDWVIKAFNDDMPFDQFTIEQLAGDMLDHPTDQQLIATAFHRNTMDNDEGGTEDEEFRVAAMFDRVATTWEVWQGTTMACVQCHSHPYDPIRHKEYYQAFGIFNNTRDEDTEGEHPKLRFYSADDEKQLERIKDWVAAHDNTRVFETERFLKTLEPKYHPHDFDRFVNGELIDTKWLGIRSSGSARLRNIPLDHVDLLYINYWAGSDGGNITIHADNLNGPIVAQANVAKTEGRKTIGIRFRSMPGNHDLFFKFSNPRIKPSETVCGIEWFAFRKELPGKTVPGFQSIHTAFDNMLNAKVDNVPVMIENGIAQKRKTNIFERGNWMVKGNEVVPGIPKVLNPSGMEVSDRLAFAKWLVSPRNPLTARVIVNRIWEQIFGAGLVETLEDFGSQGALPTNPELLDWLAIRFMTDNAWSMKKTIRDIVLSKTYRQESRFDPATAGKDVLNRYFSRAPRVRLSAEQVRDQALAVSGLLSTKMYGPSVMPYQPKGIWQSVWSGAEWKQSNGDDAHRRSVYTFVKRTSPYPSMMMFDGSSREVCVGRRIRTNTPLQALVTLNDSVFVEAAIHFGKKMIATAPTPEQQIANGYSMLTFKPISAEKSKVLLTLYNEGIAEYKMQPERIGQLTGGTKDVELASMINVATALLNLDEVIMKE